LGERGIYDAMGTDGGGGSFRVTQGEEERRRKMATSFRVTWGRRRPNPSPVTGRGRAIGGRGGGEQTASAEAGRRWPGATNGSKMVERNRNLRGQGDVERLNQC
jgi:hypothetical protein